MSATPDNESLWKKLHSKEVLEEFQALMFDQQMRYEDLLEQLEKWGISSSLGALSRFADSQRSAWAMARAKRHCEALLVDDKVDLNEAQRKVVAERLFNLAASPHISEKALLKMREMEIKQAVLKQNERKLEQAERRLAMLEKQVNDTTDDLKNPNLTEEQRAARMRARFGV
jgi:uncharacterized protein YggL (DUF469 family)